MIPGDCNDLSSLLREKGDIFVPVLQYCMPSAIVKAISITASAPASCMWYPDIDIELNFGMFYNKAMLCYVSVNMLNVQLIFFVYV